MAGSRRGDVAGGGAVGLGSPPPGGSAPPQAGALRAPPWARGASAARAFFCRNTKNCPFVHILSPSLPSVIQDSPVLACKEGPIGYPRMHINFENRRVQHFHPPPFARRHACIRLRSNLASARPGLCSSWPLLVLAAARPGRCSSWPLLVLHRVGRAYTRNGRISSTRPQSRI